MRKQWLVAVVLGLAGAVGARADVVIGYAPPAATAPMPAGPPACGAQGCDAGGCARACKPSLRERLRVGARCKPCAAGCAAPAAAPCPTPCQPAKGCKARCGTPLWDRVKAWLCYQPHRGCCNKLACGCKPAPLYTYFADDCAQGPGCNQAPACCEKPPLWKRLCGSGHNMFSSPTGHGCGAGGAAGGCAGGACGAR